jgi:predicted dinucleotide-binding enzyme
MGAKLGTIFARKGHDVVFSYARTKGKLERLARAAGENARAGSVAAAAHQEVVLLAIHWSRLGDVLKQAGDLAGKVVITCSLPMSKGDSRLVIARTSSGAEALQEKRPKARVVSAFGTVPSEVFFPLQNSRKRPSLLYCGDDRKAKRVAAQLITDVGFDPVDAGPLKMARYMEPFTLLIAQLAYESGESAKLAYRFERYERP